MGGCIQFFEFPYNVDKQKAYERIEEWGENNIDREETSSYHGNFKFLSEGTIYNSRKEAEDYLLSLPKYCDRAVLYYKFPKRDITSKETAMYKQIDKIKEKAKDYLLKHAMQTFKSNYITCKHCESKINKSYIGKEYSESKCDFLERGDFGSDNHKMFMIRQTCPVCGKDMRADYIIEKEKEFTKELQEKEKAYIKLGREINEKKFKPEKIWLAKAEVHC